MRFKYIFTAKDYVCVLKLRFIDIVLGFYSRFMFKFKDSF